jgi:hypothetical protein
VWALEEFHLGNSVRPVVSHRRHGRVRSQHRRPPNLPTRVIPTKFQVSRSILLALLSKIRQRSRHGVSPAENPDPSTSRRITQTVQRPILTLPKSENLASREIQMPLLFNAEREMQAQMLTRLLKSRPLRVFRGRHKPLLRHCRIFMFPLLSPPNRPKKARMRIFNDPFSLSSPTLPHPHLRNKLNHSRLNHSNQLAPAVRITILFGLISIPSEKPSLLIIRTTTLKARRVILTP